MMDSVTITESSDSGDEHDVYSEGHKQESVEEELFADDEKKE